jgi:tRNA(His) 5'-end guanylyltransferase
MERSELIEAYKSDHHVYENFATTKAMDGYIGLRIDGRSFHTFTKDLEKPFDSKFEAAMEAGCETLMKDFDDAVLCYVQSDEVSLVFDKETQVFDRRVEKLTSLGAAIMSVAFATQFGNQATFDARMLCMPTEEDAMAMLAERQQDALKNAATSMIFYKLCKDGMSNRAAARKIDPLSMGGRIALLEELEEPFNTLAPERRRGRMLVRKTVMREGYNPIAKKRVRAQRNELEWDRDMPDFRYLDKLPGKPARRKPGAHGPEIVD